MKDPFYAGLMYALESRICALDDRAREAGVILSDSQIQSMLIKLEKSLRGKSPGIPQGCPRDQMLAVWIEANRTPPEELRMERIQESGETVLEPISIGDWLLAVMALIESVKKRRSPIPGSRAYLDFVHDFIARASKKREN
jgi:hypothetical protein